MLRAMLLVFALLLPGAAAAVPCQPAITVVEEEGLARLAGELEDAAPKLWDRAQRMTGAESCAPITVHLVENNRAARSLLPAWHLPPWAAGAARPDQRVIVLTVAGDTGGHDHQRVFLHELAHLAIADAAGERVPRWFDEGVSRRVAGEDGQDDDRVLAEARIGKRLLPLEGLGYSFPGAKTPAAVAYAVSGRAIELLESEDPEVVRKILTQVHGGVDFEDALLAETGRRTWRLTNDVHESVAVWHAWMTLLREVDIFLGFGGVIFLFAGVQALRRRRLQIANMPNDAPLPLVAASQGIRVVRWST